MQKLTDNEFFVNNETMYNVLSDFINDLPPVLLEDVTPEMPMDVPLVDCYLDHKGDLYTPKSYQWIKGVYDPDDEEWNPLYSKEPTLTKLEIANMVAQSESPELNNPANFTN